MTTADIAAGDPIAFVLGQLIQAIRTARGQVQDERPDMAVATLRSAEGLASLWMACGLVGMPCWSCGETVVLGQQQCPHCGAEQPPF